VVSPSLVPRQSPSEFVRSNISAKKSKILSYMRKKALCPVQTFYCICEMATPPLQARSLTQKSFFCPIGSTTKSVLALAERASIGPPRNMLFFADTLESVFFFADTICFFAMKLLEMGYSRSFHFALSLELTELRGNRDSAFSPPQF
jgi:hypothetical protein